MRLIDADSLFEQIRHNDLEFMQQADLMICIKDIIDRQPTASEAVKYVLMASDNTFYKSEHVRYGVTIKESHIFQNEEQAQKVKEKLETGYAETTYTIKPISITLL